MPKYKVTKNMGSALKNLRQYRKIKAVDLAKAINKTGAYISKLEKGELNTIDCDDFIQIIRTMSQNKEEFSEAIDALLKDTSMEFSEDEQENEEWKLNLDYFYRVLPIKDEYKLLVSQKMEELHISSTELSNYINANFDIYNDETLNKEDLDKAPRNQWIFNDGHSYVLMEISAEKIDKILSPESKSSCYGNLFCILMSLYRLDKLDKDKAYMQAHNDLEGMGIITLRDTEQIMQSYDEKRKIHDLLSQRNNEQLPAENRKLLAALNDLVQQIYSFSVINTSYVNEKISILNSSFKEDPVITLKLMGTDILSLKDKPTQLKKDFFYALDDLIQEYSTKVINEEPPELL